MSDGGMAHERHAQAVVHDRRAEYTGSGTEGGEDFVVTNTLAGGVHVHTPPVAMVVVHPGWVEELGALHMTHRVDT